MKFTLFTTALIGCLSLTSAAPTLAKRATSTSEKASTGFATLNGGTSGGAGGKTVTVSTLSALQSALKGDAAAIVLISGTITGATKVDVGSNKSVLGKDSKAALVGVGLRVNKEKNVIIRNLKISKVKASSGDGIAIQASKNVWVDHVDLSSDMNSGKDYYDGLLDVTHASDFITVSNSYLHDHYKASLVGHSDSNGSEDKGHLTVTYHGNHFKNLNSRAPSFRFGTGHLFNNYFNNVSDGINARQGAQLLVQNNVWENSKKAIYSTNGGFVVASGNSFNGGKNTAPTGTLKSVSYKATVASVGGVKASVVANAGNKLSF